jgi:hypothetical protein
MKTKPLIIFGVLAALVVGYIISIIPNIRARSDDQKIVSALQSLPRDQFISAVQKFVHDHHADGAVFRGSILLNDLISGGYLRMQDVAGLQGRDVSVSLPRDDTKPQELWIRVRAGDGSVIGLLGDGSIQKLAKR